MFVFGSPEDIAKVYWENALAVPGPILPDCPIEEMSEEDLMYCLAYCRIAVVKALEEDSPGEDVLIILLSEFDRVFEVAVNSVDSFRAAFADNKHRYLGGYGLDNVNKYRALANMPPLAN
jgi:hypothetical protein